MVSTHKLLTSSLPSITTSVTPPNQFMHVYAPRLPYSHFPRRPNLPLAPNRNGSHTATQLYPPPNQARKAICIGAPKHCKPFTGRRGPAPGTAAFILHAFHIRTHFPIWRAACVQSATFRASQLLRGFSEGSWPVDLPQFAGDRTRGDGPERVVVGSRADRLVIAVPCAVGFL